MRVRNLGAILLALLLIIAVIWMITHCSSEQIMDQSSSHEQPTIQKRPTDRISSE